MQPTTKDLHANRPLTNVSVAYAQSQDNFIADKVFANVPVNNQSDTYWKYEKDQWYRSNARERAPSTESPRTGWKVSDGTYAAKVYSVAHPIDDQLRGNADAPFNLDRSGTKLVTTDLLIKRELLFADKYFKSGVWGADRTGVAAGPGANQFLQWNDASSTPIKDIKKEILAYQERTGYTPNVVAMSPWVEYYLLEHASIVDRVKYTNGNLTLSRALLAQLMGIERIYVPKAISNGANEGATFNPAFIYGKHMWMGYVTDTPSLEEPSAGYTFSWKGYIGATGMGSRILKYRQENIHSDVIEGEMAFDLQVISGDLGLMFVSAVA